MNLIKTFSVDEETINLILALTGKYKTQANVIKQAVKMLAESEGL